MYLADEDAFLPQQAEGLEGVGVVDICAGDSHSAALSDDGRVFACGVFRV
jgi:alpha-tubulin suppressor-like RCC1 family protein